MENDIKFEDFVDIDDFINTNESSEDGPVGQDGNEYEKMTIMELMDEVVTFSKCHKLDEAFFFNESSLLSELSSRIHVSPFQAVLISILVEEGQRMSLQDFGRVLGYTRIRILREIGSFMDLSERHIFEPSSCAKRGYRLNEDALEAYCADQDYVYHIPTGIDNVQFFELAQKILVKIQSESSSHRYAVAWGEVEELLQANQQLTFASTMLTYDGLTDIQRITLIYMALRLCCNGRSALVDTTIERDLNMDFAGAYSIEEVILALRASKMVDYSFADGHAFDLRYSLTEKACQELFPGLKMEQKLDCQEVVIP